jgi:hypothetical protein
LRSPSPLAPRRPAKSGRSLGRRPAKSGRSLVHRLVVAGLAALAWFSVAGRARAASARPILEALDVASVPCLDRDGLGGQLRTWLRRDDLDSRITIVVRPDPNEPSRGPISFFILRDGQPVVERWLPHADVGCEQLRAAVGLAIAISVETMLVKNEEEPRARANDESVLDFVPSPPKREIDERRFSFGLWLLGSPALLPSPALGLSAELAVRVVAPFEISASFMGTSPVHAEIGSGAGDLTLVAGRLDGCIARYHGLIGSRACLGGAVGRLVADGSGYTMSYTPRLTWAGLLAKLEVGMRVSSGFRVAIGMDGVLPLVVPRLEVRSMQGELVASATLPRFGAIFFVGPQVDF